MILQSVVSRTKVADLKSVLKRWGWLEQEVEQINEGNTKREITNALLQICEEKEDFTKDVYGELDLICTQQYSTRKQWSVYLMEKNDEHFISDSSLSQPEKLKKKLKNELTVFFERENVVSVRKLDGVMWIRIYIQSGPGEVYRSSDTVYIIYYPRTQYVVMSRYKKSVETYLMQSIQNVMGCDKLTNILLTGSHYESLLQLALDRKSQGDFSRYRLQQVQNLPLLKKKPLKRKERDFERNPYVLCEDSEAKKQRREYLQECFGPNEQPVLEKLEFKVAVKLKGSGAPPPGSEENRPFNCRIKFEGSSVIEGIRNLADCGLVSLPLPKYLASVHTLGKNHIKLASQEQGGHQENTQSNMTDSTLNKPQDKDVNRSLNRAKSKENSKARPTRNTRSQSRTRKSSRV